MTEKRPNPAVDYVQESVMELKRISWPTGKQAFRLTVIVLAFCLAAAALIGLLDMGLNFGYGKLLELAKQV